MKAFVVIVLIFGAVIYLVYQTGYYSHSELENIVVKAEPVKETPARVTVEQKPEPLKIEEPKPKVDEPKAPEVKIVYVPQITEKVYVKEVIRTERIVYHQTQRQNSQYPETRPVSYSQPQYNDRCSSFTGEAKTNCFRYVQYAGNRCEHLQGQVNYYHCLKLNGGER